VTDLTSFSLSKNLKDRGHVRLAGSTVVTLRLKAVLQTTKPVPLAGATALTGSAIAMGQTLYANAATLKKNHKAAILLWMGGGPSTIDIWDLKPGSSTGGPFKPISTNGDVQICEHMPMMAKNMDKMSIIRNMSSEADHTRGRYYMHTGYVPNPNIGYVPNPNIVHPGYGSVIAHELADTRPDLEIPPFVTVGGGSQGPGFLGMAWSPFSVNPNGQVANLNMGIEPARLTQRMQALRMMETGFIDDKRGLAASEHAKVLKKTLDLMTSKQMDSFKVNKEPESVQERYAVGTTTKTSSQHCKTTACQRLIEA